VRPHQRRRPAPHVEYRGKIVELNLVVPTSGAAVNIQRKNFFSYSYALLKIYCTSEAELMISKDLSRGSSGDDRSVSPTGDPPPRFPAGQDRASASRPP
jgi:hypothetical protein